MLKVETALKALRAVVSGMPEEYLDTHVRNLLDRCEGAIKVLETADEPTTSCVIMCNDCGHTRQISEVNWNTVEMEPCCEICGKYSYCTGSFNGKMIENENALKP